MCTHILNLSWLYKHRFSYNVLKSIWLHCRFMRKTFLGIHVFGRTATIYSCIHTHTHTVMCHKKWYLLFLFVKFYISLGNRRSNQPIWKNMIAESNLLSTWAFKQIAIGRVSSLSLKKPQKAVPLWNCCFPMNTTLIFIHINPEF